MDFKAIRLKCQKLSTFTEPFLTDLMYYAAKRNNLSERFDLLVKKHRKVFGGFGQQEQGLFKTQYIVFELFKEDGLIHKYLNHSYLKKYTPEEYAYLQEQAKNPWRYTYLVIQDSPSPDFFEAFDIFSEKTLLLYSPSVTQTLEKGEKLIFGGLISDNGNCYQTYGPIVGFQSFDADDIFFYATELDLNIEDLEDFDRLVNKDLFSFQLLTAFSALPLVVSRDHEVVFCNSEMDYADFDLKQWKKKFKSEYKQGVFKLSHKTAAAPPHFACAYWDEKMQELYLSSMTDFGYDQLVQALGSMGIDAPAYPFARLHISMHRAITEIFGRKPEVIPFEFLFSDNKIEESDPSLDDLNTFMGMLIPAINSRKSIDLEKMIRESGADPVAARTIYHDLMKKLNR